MIVSERMQMLDQNIFRIVGIEPKEKSVLAVKSMQHFKGAFGPIATQIIVTDAGGLSSPDLSKRIYARLRRPVFPWTHCRISISKSADETIGLLTANREFNSVEGTIRMTFRHHGTPGPD